LVVFWFSLCHFYQGGCDISPTLAKSSINALALLTIMPGNAVKGNAMMISRQIHLNFLA